MLGPFFEGIRRFGARIRILREKLYMIALISEFFDLCEAISDHISDFSDFSDFGKAILANLAILAIPRILTPRIIVGHPAGKPKNG